MNAEAEHVSESTNTRLEETIATGKTSDMEESCQEIVDDGFTIPLAPLPEIPDKSPESLLATTRQIVDDIRDFVRGKPTDHVKREEALKTLQAAILSGLDISVLDYRFEFSSSVDSAAEITPSEGSSESANVAMTLKEALLIQFGDDRATVAKQLCHAIALMARSWRDAFSLHVPAFTSNQNYLPKYLFSLTTPLKLSGTLAMEAIVRYVRTETVLRELIAYVSVQKYKFSRVVCSRFFKLILESFERDFLMSVYSPDAWTELLAACLSLAAAAEKEVRDSGRELLNVFGGKCLDQIKRILDERPDLRSKLLEIQKDKRGAPVHVIPMGEDSSETPSGPSEQVPTDAPKSRLPSRPTTSAAAVKPRAGSVREFLKNRPMSAAPSSSLQGDIVVSTASTKTSTLSEQTFCKAPTPNVTPSPAGDSGAQNTETTMTTKDESATATGGENVFEPDTAPPAAVTGKKRKLEETQSIEETQEQKVASDEKKEGTEEQPTAKLAKRSEDE